MNAQRQPELFGQTVVVIGGSEEQPTIHRAVREEWRSTIKERVGPT
jgi:hypothetical protein